MRVAKAESSKGAPGETAVAEGYARGLYKLMSYKDEYEGARLHLDAIEQARLVSEFGDDVKVYFRLHPPVLRAMGLKRKLKLGPWFVPAFKMLRSMKRLRGTPLDLFGIPSVRRLERDRKSTRLNSSHANISYAVFCLKKKTNTMSDRRT